MRNDRYSAVYDDLRKKIGNGEYDGGRLPPERCLSEAYGINRITLRKALKKLTEEGLIVRQGTRGTFISESPSPPAPSLNHVAYFHTGKEKARLEGYHGAIMTTVQQELEKRGAKMYFSIIDSAAEAKRHLSSDNFYKTLDGIILAGGIAPPILKQIKRFGLPVILIGQLSRPDPTESSTDQVLTDPQEYTRKAIRFLLGRRCLRIAFVDSAAYQWSVIAQQTYMEVLEEHDIEYREDLVLRCTKADLREGFNLSTRIEELQADGVFVRNDVVARGLYDGLMSRGIVAGRDIRWVSVGHTRDSVEHLDLPRLAVDPDSIGAAALKLLERRLTTPDGMTAREIIPHRFVNRNN